MKGPKLQNNFSKYTVDDIRDMIQSGINEGTFYPVDTFELFFGTKWTQELNSKSYFNLANILGGHITEEIGAAEMVELNPILYELSSDGDSYYVQTHDQYVKRKENVAPVFISYWEEKYYLIFVDEYHGFISIDLSENSIRWNHNTFKANFGYPSQNRVSGGWHSDAVIFFEFQNAKNVSFNFPQGGFL